MVRGRGRSDAAVSEVLGIALMVVLAATMAGALFFKLGIGAADPEAPVTVTLKSDGPPAANTKQLSVSAVSGKVPWADVALTLDGVPLAYDSSLSGNARFCLKIEDAACLATHEWDANATAVEAGQIIRVRDSALEGKTIRVVHVPSGGILGIIPVGN